MNAANTAPDEYGAAPSRSDVHPKLHPARLVAWLLVSTVAFFLAALILPGFDIAGFWVALGAACRTRLRRPSC